MGVCMRACECVCVCACMHVYVRVFIKQTTTTLSSIQPYYIVSDSSCSMAVDILRELEDEECCEINIKFYIIFLNPPLQAGRLTSHTFVTFAGLLLT